MSAGVARPTVDPILESAIESAHAHDDGRPRLLATLLDRLRRGWRGAAFHAALVVSAALIALTGVQIAQRTAADRAAVGEALQTVALHLTQSLGRQIDADRQHLLSLVLAPVQGGGAGDALPGASELEASVRARFAQLEVRPDAGLGTFRVALDAPAGASVDATGTMRDSATAAAVLRAVARLAPALHARPLMLQRAEVLVGPRPVDLHVAVRRDADGAPRAVYGVTLTHGHLVRELGARALRTLPMPVSFLGRDWRTGARVNGWAPADPRTGERRTLRALVRRPHPGAPDATDAAKRAVASPIDLFALQVRDTSGRVLFATPRAAHVMPATSFAAEYDDSALDLVIGAALDQARGEQLVSAIVGPVARTQWLLGGVAALGAFFVAGVMLQLRRRHQLAEVRRDFVAAISHELRTPLAHMALLSETLLIPAGRDEEAQRARWLGVIHREAIRLGRLVDNVLLHVRGEHRGHTIDRAWLDLEDVMDDVLASMELAADARSVRLTADFPGELMVYADMGALRQVLLNLIDNAIKHGPDGQTVAITIALEPRSATHAACVVITVDDEGPGIAPSDRARVWRPFVRLGDRGGATGGSGLGLSVVRDLVRQHGGRVELRESPLGGVRAVVSLPQPHALLG